MAKNKWKYKINDEGEIIGGVFETEVTVQSVMGDGVRGKTEKNKNAYLQIIGEFGDDTHRGRFPKLMKNGLKIKIKVEVKDANKDIQEQGEKK